MTKSNAPAPLTYSAYELVAKAANETERYAAGQYAIETVNDPATGQPMPRFIFDLPWAADGGDAQDEILARVAAADDIEQASEETKLRKARSIVGERVLVYGLLARASDVEESKWKCYLALTCSVANGGTEVINCGAPQVMVIMWRAYMEGKLPLLGTFIEVGTPKKGQDRALSFRIESQLA